MSMRSKILATGALTVLTPIIAATGAMAAPKPFCQNYATAAVIQFNRMQQLNLGCTGFRWHNWHDGHYQWCRRVSEQSARSEARTRARAINGNGAC